MRKARRIDVDTRGVAIYTRKSRITNKGDSTGVQFKQCAEYAKKELHLNDDYEFLEYEDRELSGCHSDRPEFQRMLRDVQDGKIRAIVCYKLDRVGRNTTDLLRLMDFLEKYNVNLLVCSNGINTASGFSKIFIRLFSVVEEFERDTLTERITNKMMELAKDGRGLDGNIPMGFAVQRVTTGRGKKKSVYSCLVSIPEEKSMIQRLYTLFLMNHSVQTTAKQMNLEGFRTPSGAKFNASTTRQALRNPIYCTADKCSYDYFIEHEGHVFGDLSDFDGQHGLSVYNKTDQEQFENNDSTFISPKFVQTVASNPINEWIIAVGKHEGFISSEHWIETQELLDAGAEKYNRSHRKTNALLAGLIYCPCCGKRLDVISESGRWTNEKPRFKYVCPGYRKKNCSFMVVDGSLLDQFIVQQLSDMSEEDREHFKEILEIKIEEQSGTTQEYALLQRKREKLQTDIVAQTRNMREVDERIRCYLQDDIQAMSEELRETERMLFKQEENRKNRKGAVGDLEQTKEGLLSFAWDVKEAQPEALVTLIRTIVERIYIIDKEDERFCHIFIKGCTGEDYTGFFQTADYIEYKTTLVRDLEQSRIHTPSVASELPGSVKEWNAPENGSLSPYDMPPETNRKVWWRCEKGHEWQETGTSRAQETGCPVCRNRKNVVDVNALETTYPALERERNYEKITFHNNNSFKEYLISEEKSALTIDKYLRDVKRFLSWLGARELTKGVVLQYKEELAENYAVASVNSILSSLNSWLNFVGRSDCRVKILKQQRRTYLDESKELSRTEYERLLRAADHNPRLFLLMQTICATGIRVSEHRFITVEAARAGEAEVRLKGKHRKVFLPKKLCKALLKYAKERGIRHGTIFVTASGKPLNRCNIWAEMKKLCDTAGVSREKVFPHNLRHLFARIFYGQEKDIVRLADVLGHSNINTTRIYTMESGRTHKRQIERMNLTLIT